MRFAPRLLPVLVLATLAAPAVAGPPGFAFLEVPAGARAASLGGAYTSLASGAEAAFWNPAALDGVRGLQLTGTHVEFLERLRHEQVAVAGRVLGGGLAASMRAMYSEPIEERDDLGNQIGTFGSHDLEFRLGWGTRMAGGLSLGGSAQVVRERLAEASATTYAFGAGAVWAPESSGGLRLSLVADQLGPPGHYLLDGVRGEPVPLPASLQGGASYGLPVGSGLTLRGALESRLTRGRSGVAMLGAELAQGVSGAAVRVGARVNDDQSSMAFGAGYAFPSLRVDYAFVPFRLDLGDTHRLSLGAQF
jgi:hypothetical protein